MLRGKFKFVTNEGGDIFGVAPRANVDDARAFGLSQKITGEI